MNSAYYLCVISGGVVVMYGVFSVPALTSGSISMSFGGSQAELDTAISEELDYCRNQVNNFSCQCFSKLSGTILAHSEPRVHGVVYADKQQLARGQASRSC